MKVIIIRDFRPFIFPSNNSFALIELTVTNNIILINPEKNSTVGSWNWCDLNLFKEAVLVSYGYYVLCQTWIDSKKKITLSVTRKNIQKSQDGDSAD